MASTIRDLVRMLEPPPVDLELVVLRFSAKWLDELTVANPLSSQREIVAFLGYNPEYFFLTFDHYSEMWEMYPRWRAP